MERHNVVCDRMLQATRNFREDPSNPDVQAAWVVALSALKASQAAQAALWEDLQNGAEYIVVPHDYIPEQRTP